VERKRNRPNGREIIAIHGLLHAHCRKGDDGYAVFDDGWSDEKIALEVSTEKNLFASVQNMRLSEDLGVLRMKSAPKVVIPDARELMDLLGDLEHRIVCLERAIARAWNVVEAAE